MRQFVQLTEWQETFAAMGVAVVGMTYDSRALQKAFHSEHALGFPLLQDVAAQHVNAWGIRNAQYGPDHAAYGVPHPGIVYLDAEGVIRAKFAVAGYRQRPPYETVRDTLATLLQP